MLRLRAAVLVLCTASTTGCVETAGEVEPLGSEVRDSAGIVIVENEAPHPTSRLPWAIEPEPFVTIGAVEGDPAYQLFGVEDALRLDDGRILVANGGSSEIRVFDASGTHLDSWGGEGEGPGEFVGLTDVMRWPGDSIVAGDFRTYRLTIYDSRGRRGRTLGLTLGDELGPGTAVGVLPDGHVLVQSQISWTQQERVTALVRRSRDYVLLDAAGNGAANYGRHQDEEYFIRGEEMAILRHPFRRSLHPAAWGERVVIAPSDRYEIRAYDREGELTAIVRRDHDLVPPTQADLDEQNEARLAELDPDERPSMARLFEGMPLVEAFPAFSRVLADATHHLWVKEYTKPRDDTSIWTVFDPDGRVLGLVETPPGLLVYDIGTDYLLGRATDDLDVEYVQLWRLTRG